MSLEVSVGYVTENKIMINAPFKVEELRIVHKQDGNFTYTIKTNSWLGGSKSFDLDLDHLNCLQEYYPRRFMLYGPAENCWSLYKMLPESWFNSLNKVEIHLTDKALTEKASSYWREEVRRRLCEMDFVTNIIIGDDVFGTESMVVIYDSSEKFRSEDRLKKFLVHGKELNPTTEDYVNLREGLALKSTTRGVLAVLMRRKSTIAEKLNELAWKRGGEFTCIEDFDILMKERNNTSSHFIEANPRKVGSQIALFLIKILPFLIGIISIIWYIAACFGDSEVTRRTETLSSRFVRVLTQDLPVFTIPWIVRLRHSSWRNDAYC